MFTDRISCRIELPEHPLLLQMLILCDRLDDPLLREVQINELFIIAGSMRIILTNDSTA